LTAIAAAAIAAAPEGFAELVFRDAARWRLMLIAAGTLVAVTGFNFCTELFTALRRSRVASNMQFAHALLFTGLSLLLLATVWASAEAVVFAYGAACLVACVGAFPALRGSWRLTPAAEVSSPQRDFWSKLLPFACWIWATNLLINLSDVADRYMILYFASGDAGAASALVGQYHSSRIAPDLLASLAVMIAGVMLPYNSHDWESDARDAVSLRIRLAVKGASLAFLGAGAALLAVAGPLFEHVLGGKYAAGEAILPWTLALCTYFGLTILAANYLWCAERAGRAVAVMGAGLIVNVLLNLLLLPRLGLPGAVIATAAANGATLALTLRCNAKLGMQLDAGVFVAALAPLALLIGPAAAAGAFIALAGLGCRNKRLLPERERAHLAQTLKSLGPARWRPRCVN
jgi:O-antigen/teichoic acid export membrane protein